MADIDPSALQRSDLNSFLFADIGEEANGMTLSVLSTLARSDVDPWQEAERLAKLPRPEATRELAKTIAAMPATAWSLADAAAIAERLVVLLPSRGSHLPIFPSTQSVLSTQSAGASMAVSRQGLDRVAATMRRHGRSRNVQRRIGNGRCWRCCRSCSSDSH